MKKVVIATCLHLRESYRYGKFDKDSQMDLRLKDLLGYLSQVVNFSVDNKVDTVVFLGDVFDSPTSSEELKSMFYSRIKKLVYRGIKIYILIGNHDTDGRVSAFDGSRTLAEDVLRSNKIKIVSEPYILEEDGNSFGFVPWSNHIEDDVKMMSEGVNYLFGHFVVSGDKDSPPYTSIVKDGSDRVDIKLLKGFKHCFLGHIHTHYTCPKYTYVGSLMKLTFKAVGESKGFLFADFTTKKKRFIKIGDREFVKLVVEEGSRGITVGVSNVKDNIVKLIFRGSKEFLTSLDRSSTIERVRGGDPFKLIVSSELIESDDCKQSENVFDIGEGVEECIEEWCKEKKKGRSYLNYGLEVLKKVR